VSLDVLLADRLASVRERMTAAAARAGRRADSVRLVPASKVQPVEALREAYDAGLRDFGENRVQELVAKAALLPADVRWHLIGSLQRNKVRRAVEIATLIHSVDGARLAEAIGAARPGMHVLVEVNTSNEASKHGVAPERVVREVEAIASAGDLAIDGLMTMGPAPHHGMDERATRAAFAMLRRCLLEVNAAGVRPAPLTELSMGMSGDFEWAIEEGATIVRIGTALFGPRRT
jgi:pyridoxal phosphate enzyme (YggS family)